MNQRAKPRPDNAMKNLANRITGTGPRWQQILRWVAAVSVSGSVLFAITFFVLYQVIDIPDANADFKTQTTNVYYSDGKHRIGTFATQDRENVTLDEVSEDMQAAVIAAEDRTFYSNRGIDIRGIIRAARNNATSGEITGGGSTITQQYVKILYLTQEQSYVRKFREAILSIKIHNQLSKQEILEGYLNTIYFGNGAYGVQVASRTYFEKPASELDVQESAALATILNQPSFYDPYSESGKEQMMPRYEYVLDGMAKAGAISAADAAQAQDELPTFAKKKDSNRYKGPNGHLLRLVQEKMNELEFTDDQVLGGGLKITTTIGYAKQRAAVRAIESVPPKKKKLHPALVSIQPGTGAVKAMYGGKDYLENQLNWATSGTQPGSTFKVFALIAALEDGYSLRTRLNGSSPIQVGGNTIENQGDSGGQSFGPVTLERATQKSINTAFVDLTQQLGTDKDEAAEGTTGGGTSATEPTGDITVGTQKIRDAARDAGIPDSALDKFDPAAAVTPLGYVPVAPVDMANAYATVAAGGKRAEWYVIEKVEDPEGTTLHEHERENEQTIPEDVAGDTIAALEKVVNSGTAGTGSRGRTQCPTIGKTGTATAGSAENQHVSSSWFAGATPKLATAVMFNRGVGNEDLEGYLVPFFGGTYPAMTFKAYMDVAINPTSCGEFIEPGNIRSDKGRIFNPTPNCDDDERLNASRTQCVERGDGDGDGDGDGGGGGDGDGGGDGGGNNGNDGDGDGDGDGGIIDGNGNNGNGQEGDGDGGG